jgi:hypothetical protein
MPRQSNGRCGKTRRFVRLPSRTFPDWALRLQKLDAERQAKRVNDNLLGSAGYCPLIRRTGALDRFMGAGLDKQGRALADGSEPGVLARAVSYLYTKETKSSYAIEGESPAPTARIGS